MNKGLGIGAIVLGILAAVFCWIPFCGLGAIPIAVIGLLLASIGMIISFVGKKSGVGMPAAGAIICIVAISIAIFITNKTATTINNALRPPAPPIAEVIQAQTQAPAQAQTQTQPVPRLETLLNGFPTEFCYDEKGSWDEFTFPKVDRWIDSNLIEKECEVDLFAAFCGLGSSLEPDEFEAKMNLWSAINIKFRGDTKRVLINEDRERRFTIKVDEKLAREWRREISRTAYNAFRESNEVIGGVYKLMKVRAKIESALFGSSGEPVRIGIKNQSLSFCNDPESLLEHTIDFALDESEIWCDPDNLLKTGKNSAPSTDSHIGDQWHFREGSATAIKQLEKSGEYRLVYANISLRDGTMAGNNDKTKDHKNQGILFATRLHDAYILRSEQIIHLCDTPPTEAQIAKVKKVVNWPSQAK